MRIEPPATFQQPTGYRPSSILERLRSLTKPIRIGIIGVGSMGRGLLYQTRITPGIDCVAIADLDIDRAVAAAKATGHMPRVVQTAAEMEDAIAAGQMAVCEDGLLVAGCESTVALVESSSAILAAGDFAVTSIMRGKHLILMNAECDLIFGPYLLQLARRNGVTYTSCDGDQHGVIKHLLDEVALWGFAPIIAGNIKGFLDRQATPTSIVEEADKRNLDYRMATAYTDGTKLNIEMALLANACGFRASLTGMHGPRASDVHEVFDLFDLENFKQGPAPVVDYLLGANPGGGVFVVGHCDDPYARSMLEYYKMGGGPFYLFYRPYHLCHIEAMACIVDACLDRKSLLEPRYGFQTNVIAFAKRTLRAGETLDGIGGFTCYGKIENVNGSADEGLPICLADGVTLLRGVVAGERITMTDVRVEPQRGDFELFARAQAAV